MEAAIENLTKQIVLLRDRNMHYSADLLEKEMLVKVLEVKLQDDETPFGGTLYQGETLEEFLREAELTIPEKVTTEWIDEVNKVLKQNGIKGITETV